MSYIMWQARFDNAARWFAVATLFAVPLPTAISNISAVLFVLCWIGGGSFTNKFRIILRNPVALTALGLLLLLIIGISYTPAQTSDALLILKKYRKLIYLALAIAVLDDPVWRTRGVNAFVAAMTLILALSWARSFGILEPGPYLQELTVFKGRITHNIFMAFAVFILAHRVFLPGRWRWLWLLLVLFYVHNVFFMVNGRTGQLVLFLLMSLLMYQRWSWKGLAVSIGVVGMCFAMAYSFSPHFQSRFDEISSEMQRYKEGDVQTSVGYRLQYYTNTVELIKTHPWLGGGTGSFEHEYAQKAVREQFEPVRNPHNQYLMMMTEAGLPGLAAFILLLVFQWRQSAYLDKHNAWLNQGLVLIMAVGCLLNSLLLDFAEGHFFVFMAAMFAAASHDRLPDTREAERVDP